MVTRLLLAILLATNVKVKATDSTAAPPATPFANACFLAATWQWPARKALSVCTAALRERALTPHARAAILVNRGIVEFHARKLNAAIADYDAALAAEPDLADALVNKGIALVAGGRDAEAVPVLTDALAAEPTRPEVALYARAEANETLGETRAAYEDYSRAAELAPEWNAPAEQLRRFSIVRRRTARG